MKGKKRALAQMLVRLGATSRLLRLRGLLPGSRLSILTYHSVANLPADYPFDRDVADATPETFDRQLQFLSEHCSVVDLDQVLEALHGAPLPRNAVLLTFDDGYKSCRDVILPLLQKRGQKAVFFVATEFVDTRRLYWWELLSFAIKTTTKRSLSLTYPSARQLQLTNRYACIQRLLVEAKSTFGLDPRRFALHLAEAAEVPMPPDRERELADQLIMSWDDIRALKAAGMAVESHTHTHRVLQTVPDGELSLELLGCRERLEAETGAPVRTIAYPAGGSIMEEQRILDALSAAGYDVGFTNGTGQNTDLRRAHRFDVRRFAMDPGQTQAEFQTRLALPRLVS